MEITETDSMIETQTAKQENLPQKSGLNQNKKGRGRRGGRSHNAVNSIQPLTEQNPPAKV